MAKRQLVITMADIQSTAGGRSRQAITAWVDAGLLPPPTIVRGKSGRGRGTGLVGDPRIERHFGATTQPFQGNAERIIETDYLGAGGHNHLRLLFLQSR